MSNQYEIMDEAVEAGIELLDDRYPGWYRSIKLSQLDLSSAQFCVIGQLAYDHGRSFAEELHVLGVRHEPYEYGFDFDWSPDGPLEHEATDEDVEQAFAYLTERWFLKIRERQFIQD